MRAAELILEETSINLDGCIQINRSSSGHDWSDIAAILTREPPHTTLHRPVPSLWLATMIQNKVHHQRVIDGKILSGVLCPHTILITPPGIATEDTIFQEGTALHVFLHQDVLAEIAQQLLDKPLREVKIRPGFLVSDPVLLCLMRTLEHMLSDLPNSSLQSNYVARAIATHILRFHTEPLQGSISSQTEIGLSPTQIDMINDFMWNNLGEVFRYAELASLTGLSRTAFFQRFKRSMKRTPHQHLQIIRVKRAQELLKIKELPLAEIAFICGFADQTHFTRTFRRYVGVTPGCYRMQMR